VRGVGKRMADVQTGMAAQDVGNVVDEEFEEEMRVKRAQMERARRKSIGKPADHAVWAAKVEADKAAKEAAEKAKKDAEAREWEKAKNMLAARAQAAPRSSGEAGKAILQAIETLATKAVEAEEHAERCDRLGKILPAEQVAGMRQRARTKSRELQEEIAQMMEGKLEEAFHQFDADGSGALDMDELAAAYKAAGMQISDAKLRKCIKLLDTNGDGVIDLEEFKGIGLKLSMMNAKA